MIDAILENEDLVAISRGCCEENDMAVDICEELLVDGEIKEKFKTAVHKFMSDDFDQIFLSDRYNILKLKAWLVTDPFKAFGLTDEQYRKKIKGTALDFYSTFRPLKFRNLIAQIEPVPPPVVVCI